MESRKISIIIPVYNVEKYIEQCIKSVINQTYSNYEVVVVDDGSSDSSIDIVKRCIADTNVPCKIITKKNGGVSSARNLGILEAEGEYIIAIDSDDVILPNTLEILINIIENNQVECVFMEYEPVKATSELNINLDSQGSLIIQSGETACNDYYVRKRNYIAPALLVAKKFLLRNAIEYNEKCRFAEDDLFVWSVLANVEKIAHYSGKLYKYIIHENSTMTSSSYEKYLSSYYAAIEVYQNDVIASTNTKYVKKTFLARHMLGVIHAACKVLPYGKVKELIEKTNFSLLCKNLYTIREMRIFLMIVIFKFSSKLFYLVCKNL